MAPARSARVRRSAAASVAAAWRRRSARACSIGAGASSGTTSVSGNALRDSSRIALVCLSTASAMAGSTWRGAAALRCAASARR